MGFGNPAGVPGEFLGAAGILMMAGALSAILFRGYRGPSGSRLPRRWLPAFLAVLAAGTVFSLVLVGSLGIWVKAGVIGGVLLLILSCGLGGLICRAFPKGPDGRARGRREVEHLRSKTLSALQNRGCLHGLALARRAPAGPDAEPQGMVEAIAAGMDSGRKSDLGGDPNRVHVGSMRADGRVHPEVEVLAAEEARLNRELTLLHPLQRTFRLWLRIHLPLASIMTVVMIGALLWTTLASLP